MSRREHLLPGALGGRLKEQPGGFREALQAFLEASGAQSVDLPALQTTAWLVRLSDSSKLHVYEEELTADNFACDCCRIVGEWGGRRSPGLFFCLGAGDRRGQGSGASPHPPGLPCKVITRRWVRQTPPRHPPVAAAARGGSRACCLLCASPLRLLPSCALQDGKPTPSAPRTGTSLCRRRCAGGCGARWLAQLHLSLAAAAACIGRRIGCSRQQDAHPHSHHCAAPPSRRGPTLWRMPPRCAPSRRRARAARRARRASRCPHLILMRRTTTRPLPFTSPRRTACTVRGARECEEGR